MLDELTFQLSLTKQNAELQALLSNVEVLVFMTYRLVEQYCAMVHAEVSCNILSNCAMWSLKAHALLLVDSCVVAAVLDTVGTVGIVCPH